jgi:hypothetical protein
LAVEAAPARAKGSNQGWIGDKFCDTSSVSAISQYVTTIKSVLASPMEEEDRVRASSPMTLRAESPATAFALKLTRYGAELLQATDAFVAGSALAWVVATGCVMVAMHEASTVAETLIEVLAVAASADLISQTHATTPKTDSRNVTLARIRPPTGKHS